MKKQSLTITLNHKGMLKFTKLFLIIVHEFY